MKTHLALILALVLPGAYMAEASPRQVNAPVHRAIDAYRQSKAEEQARRESRRPGIMLVSPSPNQVIGKVTRVNLEQGFAVGWLHSRYLGLSGQIITRDEQLRTTAVLSVGSARSNRAAGLQIQSGAPNIGDEIVIVTTTWQTPEGQTATPQAATAQNTEAAQQPPPSLRPHWHMQQGAAHQPAIPQPAAQPSQQEQPQLIPAHRMRGMSNAKPEVQTRITVTVE